MIDEHLFTEGYVSMNSLRYSNGVFYTPYGAVSEDSVLKDIYDTIGQPNMLKTSLASKSRALLDCAKIEANKGDFKVDKSKIPFENGDLVLGGDKWTFYENRLSQSPYRLPISFIGFDDIIDTPNFDKWLNDLFDEDDQKTLQEFLGYCLLPTTDAQEALLLVGDGGSGKSVLGSILSAMFGKAMLSVDNMHDFLEDKFKIPELENKLVMYDDDLKDTALNDTGFFKKLITNTGYITADRKYSQPFQFKPYTRIIACANFMLTSRFDTSEGFYRRLHPLLIKPKPDDREVIRGFDRMVSSEVEGIVQWALIGLKRLMDNDFSLTRSDKTEIYMSDVKSLANHFPEFMETCFEFSSTGQTSTKEINDTYRLWCSQNSIDERKTRALQRWITDNTDKYNIKSSTHIRRGNKDVRGFLGIAIKSEWNLGDGLIRLED